MMISVSQHAWKILTAIGLLFVGWGINQIFVIPTNTDHWDWLTYDPEVIKYIKGWSPFRGIWSVANGLFFALVAATAFKHQERWAWWVLAYLPVHLILLTSQAYWLFFITVPLLALAVWSLWISRDNIRPASESGRKFGWIFFFIIGLAFLYFAYDNIFVIPTLDVYDPDRGWAWLTTDPEIIDYFKFHFRLFGVWILAFGMLILLTAMTGLRAGSRRAWGILFIVPILVGVHFFIWPWTAPILIGVILFSGIGLWLSYPKTIAIENE
jgi:hypothetical protein